MSDSDTEKPIEWTTDVGLVKLQVCFSADGAHPVDATPAHIFAAGFVPAEQLTAAQARIAELEAEVGRICSLFNYRPGRDDGHANPPPALASEPVQGPDVSVDWFKLARYHQERADRLEAELRAKTPGPSPAPVTAGELPTGDAAGPTPALASEPVQGEAECPHCSSAMVNGLRSRAESAEAQLRALEAEREALVAGWRLAADHEAQFAAAYRYCADQLDALRTEQAAGKREPYPGEIDAYYAEEHARAHPAAAKEGSSDLPPRHGGQLPEAERCREWVYDNTEDGRGRECGGLLPCGSYRHEPRVITKRNNPPREPSPAKPDLPGGDRPVMLSELVEALRSVGVNAGAGYWYGMLADKLEARGGR